VRKLPGYGSITFPFCKCDARKDGFVIVSVGIKNLKLHACDDHGVLEVCVCLLSGGYGYCTTASSGYRTGFHFN